MFLKEYNKTAIVTKTETISYTQLLQNIESFCDSFSRKNYKRVVIFSENRSEWIYSFYALWKLDAIIVPIDFMSTADDVAYILNDCTPELIVYSQQTESVLEQALLSFANDSKEIEKHSMESLSLCVKNSSDENQPIENNTVKGLNKNPVEDSSKDYPQFDVYSSNQHRSCFRRLLMHLPPCCGSYK